MDSLSKAQGEAERKEVVRTRNFPLKRTGG